MEKIYSKLLLFGEHTVVKSSQALAVPFENFNGQWRFANRANDFTVVQQNLPAFEEYLANLDSKYAPSDILDTDALLIDLQKGLYFDANIPLGYGLGSSGALCAAVYERYAIKPIERTASSDFSTLKKILARMESFYHGSSSGIDPLICYLGQPVIIQADGNIELVPTGPTDFDKKASLFLFDTGISRQTGPLVQGFLKKCEDNLYEKRVISELIPANEAAIIHYLEQNPAALFEDFHAISHFQFRYMSEMIPGSFRGIWLDGLSSNYFKLKICGAGGGGFLLGICTDFSKLKEKLGSDFPNHQILKID